MRLARNRPPETIYDLIAAGLTDAELEDEVFRKDAGAPYKAALVEEAERRAQAGPPPEPARSAPIDYDDVC